MQILWPISLAQRLILSLDYFFLPQKTLEERGSERNEIYSHRQTFPKQHTRNVCPLNLLKYVPGSPLPGSLISNQLLCLVEDLVLHTNTHPNSSQGQCSLWRNDFLLWMVIETYLTWNIFAARRKSTATGQGSMKADRWLKSEAGGIRGGKRRKEKQRLRLVRLRVYSKKQETWPWELPRLEHMLVWG